MIIKRLFDFFLALPGVLILTPLFAASRDYWDRYGYHPDDFPVADANYRRMVSLPLNSRLLVQDVTDVVEAVLDVVRTYRR